jgi:molecular chaperone IbpA|tara:strand:- start:176 stop:646 length:471 start_codon:yes stop_codon:yes gene_type:complete
MTGTFMFPRNAFLGFDHIFDELERVTSHAKDTYPPHNVVKYDNNKYDIELAVAGFSKDDINIEIKEHILTIKGERGPRRDQELYVHKGISGRKFERQYRLSEYAEVTGADLTDGILTVSVEVILPEEKRPRMINITSKGVKSDGNSNKRELLNESS